MEGAKSGAARLDLMKREGEKCRRVVLNVLGGPTLKISAVEGVKVRGEECMSTTRNV